LSWWRRKESIFSAVTVPKLASVGKWRMVLCLRFIVLGFLLGCIDRISGISKRDVFCDDG
jgi:hypothetical protein